MSHQCTTSVYTRSQPKPSKTITHEMSLTFGDLTKILEAVGTKTNRSVFDSSKRD